MRNITGLDHLDHSGKLVLKWHLCMAGPYLAQMKQPLSSFPGAETQNTKKIDCPKTFKLHGSVPTSIKTWNWTQKQLANCDVAKHLQRISLWCARRRWMIIQTYYFDLTSCTISHSLPSQIYDFTCMLFHHLWFGFEQHKNDGVQPFWTLNKLNKAKNQLELKNPTEWHLGTEIISHPHFQKWRVEFQPEWSDHFHRTNKFYFIKIDQANQKLCYFLCGVHQTLTIVTWTSDLNTPVPYKYEFPLTGFYQGFSRV